MLIRGLLGILIAILTCSVVTEPAVAEANVVVDNTSVGADPSGQLRVGVGIRVEQIVFVDQKSENFSTVANIRLQWHDPKLAFDPEQYGRDYKPFTVDEFRKIAAELPTIVPGFLIHNQQERRWEQQAIITVNSDGTANYYERATVTLQAPHFNFRKFPLDTQPFYLEITSLHPSEVVEFFPMPEHSGLGDLLGEEAWIFENPSLNVLNVIGLSGLESAQVALGFTGRRHIQYYALRIFIPMLVLITVSWATFFLDEYRRRIEITSANLLAFILFNFAISEKLPELGYLTFLDFVLQWMFIVTGAIIVLNVGLAKLVKSGKEELAHNIDKYVIKWIYPLGYAAVVGFAVFLFFVAPNVA